MLKKAELRLVHQRVAVLQELISLLLEVALAKPAISLLEAI